MNTLRPDQHLFCEKCMHINQCHTKGLIYHLSNEISERENECPDFAISEEHLNMKRLYEEENPSRGWSLFYGVFGIFLCYVFAIILLERFIFSDTWWTVLSLLFTLIALVTLVMLIVSYIRSSKHYNSSFRTKQSGTPYRHRISNDRLNLLEYIEQR